MGREGAFSFPLVARIEILGSLGIRALLALRNDKMSLAVLQT